MSDQLSVAEKAAMQTLEEHGWRLREDKVYGTLIDGGGDFGTLVMLTYDGSGRLHRRLILSQDWREGS